MVTGIIASSYENKEKVLKLAVPTIAPNDEWYRGYSLVIRYERGTYEGSKWRVSGVVFSCKRFEPVVKNIEISVDRYLDLTADDRAFIENSLRRFDHDLSWPGSKKAAKKWIKLLEELEKAELAEQEDGEE